MGMTAAEMVREKVQNLSEAQAQLLLAYLDALTASPFPSASDLMRLPVAHRHAILQAQAAKADNLYRNDPELICDDTEPPLSYG
jgi:transcriptional regulator of met regulon